MSDAISAISGCSSAPISEAAPRAHPPDERCHQRNHSSWGARHGQSVEYHVSISGHQRSSVVIRGHQRSSGTTRRVSGVNQWSSEVISGHQRSSVVIRGHQGQSVEYQVSIRGGNQGPSYLDETVRRAPTTTPIRHHRRHRSRSFGALGSALKRRVDP